MDLIRPLIKEGRGLSLSDIRDLINNENDADLKTNEIKSFLIEEFGEEIKFCDPERKNPSLFVVSSAVNVEDVVNSIRNLDVVKTAGTEIRKALLGINYGLDNKFCDTQKLKKSWQDMVITRHRDYILRFIV